MGLSFTVHFATILVFLKGGALCLDFPCLAMVLLGCDFIVELVGHAEEDDGKGEPLIGVEGVLEDQDTDEDGDDLAGGGDEWIYMLLEIRNHVID